MVCPHGCENADYCESCQYEAAGRHGCSCCDPTNDSPDPVVVRLEREVERLNFDLCQCRLELTTAREIAHRLGTERDDLVARRAEANAEVKRLSNAYKSIDRANESLRERLAAAKTRNVCPECGLTPGAISTCYCEECVGEIKEKLAAAEARDLVAELRDRHIPWSRETFGDGMRTVGICKHIEKELNEIRENPYSVEEWIDVAILALDGAWRTSVPAESVVEVLFEKLSKIRTRTYPKPVSDDEPSEHIREGRAG